jgi:hypothetical protein
MLSNEQLAFAVAKLHPDLVRWKDYWVAHPVAVGSDEQTGEAEIISWQPKDPPKPSLEKLHKTFAKYAKEWEEQQKRELEDSDQPDAV